MKLNFANVNSKFAQMKLHFAKDTTINLRASGVGNIFFIQYIIMLERHIYRQKDIKIQVTQDTSSHFLLN